MVEALIGAAVGVLAICVARIIRGQRWVYSIGLLVLPSLYALFALRAGDRAVAVEEMAYGIPFVVAGLGFAFVSARHSAVVVRAYLLWLSRRIVDANLRRA